MTPPRGPHLIPLRTLILISLFVTHGSNSYSDELALFVARFFKEMLGQNFIFSINYTTAAPYFGRHHQIAVLSESQILSNTHLISDTAITNDDSPVIYLFVPSNLEIFNQIMDQISDFFRSATSTWGNQKMFYLVWPTPHLFELTDQNIVENSANYSEFLARLKTKALTIPLDQHVYILQKSSTSPVQQIFELYSVARLTSVLKLVKDDPGKADHFQMDDFLRTSPRRDNFQGVTLKVVAMSDFPDEVNVTGVNETVNFVNGASFMILEDFMRSLNFQFKPVSGTGWIDPHNLTGIGQQVLEGGADLCISTATMQQHMVHGLHFLQPVASDKEAYAFFQQPSIVSSRTIFTMPFSVPLWISVFLNNVFVGVSMYFIACWMGVGKFKNPGTSKLYAKFQMIRRKDFGTPDSVLWTIGALCQQGWYTSPWKIPLRIVFITGWLATVLIYAYYTAAFVAAISAPFTPIKKFQDFFKYNYDIFTDPDIPANTITFLEYGPVNDRILNRSEVIFKGNEKAVDRILRGNSKAAFLASPVAFYPVGMAHHNDTELCLIERIKGSGYTKVKDAMFVKKGSEYQEALYVQNVVQFERGVMRRYWTKYQIDTQLQCLKNVQSTPKLAFSDCYSAFVIMVLGQLLAICLWVGERCCNLSINSNTM